MKMTNSHHDEMMLNIRILTVTGVLTAMTVVTTMFTQIRIPVTQGYFNLGDTIILVSAILFGSKVGLFTGAVGAALADIFLGGFIFAPITFIVKGLEGFIVGKLAKGGLAAERYQALYRKEMQKERTETEDFDKESLKRKKVQWVGKELFILVIGTAVMIVGYFLAEAFILQIFDKSFGIAAAVGELPANFLQGGLSVVLARLIVESLRKARFIR